MFPITRIYSDENGESRFEDTQILLEDSGEIGALSPLFPAKGIIFREVTANYDFDFHNAPQRQYIILLDGSIEIETSVGEKREFGPGEILLVEDTSGKGHKTKNLQAAKRKSIFIPLPDEDLKIKKPGKITTIAFSGALTRKNILFLKQLSANGNRLLLANSENIPETDIAELNQKIPLSEIELVSCFKDSCWEADVIILSAEIPYEYQALRNIEEVATQKLVIFLSEESNSKQFKKLEQFLPHSKLAMIKLKAEKKEATLLNFPEVAELWEFFAGISYTLVLDNQEIEK